MLGVLVNYGGMQKTANAICKEWTANLDGDYDDEGEWDYDDDEWDYDDEGEWDDENDDDHDDDDDGEHEDGNEDED